MTPTAPRSHPGDFGNAGGPPAWGVLVETALREHGAALQDPTAALRSGELGPQTLCRYAAGKLAAGERADLETTLQRHPGALGLVVRLVRGARPGGSPLARRLVAAAREGLVEPHRAAALALLDARGAESARAALERSDPSAAEKGGEDPAARAACHLGLRELQAAREALAGLGDDDPLVAAARRVAAVEDEDEALIELLAALPG